MSDTRSATSNQGIVAGLLGDDKATIEQVQHYITPIIKNKLFSYPDWEDVRQQCLLNILVSLRKTQSVHNVWGFIRKVTICHVIDHNRRHQVQRTIFDDAFDETDRASEPSDHGGAGLPHPEDFIDRELFLYVYQRIGDVCRRLFYALFITGLSYAETSTELGTTEGNLRVRLKRCRDKALALRDEALSG